jgi:hypothetical protein
MILMHSNIRMRMKMSKKLLATDTRRPAQTLIRGRSPYDLPTHAAGLAADKQSLPFGQGKSFPREAMTVFVRTCRPEERFLQSSVCVGMRLRLNICWFPG